eukprot:TRINITY_DN1759_c0_g1_i1.p1 TRINITY_DN1759_c0_g1~~TRINITY_DN1759_c0_g1_i1.p1  ORF type:complete len:1565 (+),score=473.74 TRINITY_DN1759_c0_g1_i1:88-4695(+)
MVVQTTLAINNGAPFGASVYDQTNGKAYFGSDDGNFYQIDLNSFTISKNYQVNGAVLSIAIDQSSPTRILICTVNAGYEWDPTSNVAPTQRFTAAGTGWTCLPVMTLNPPCFFMLRTSGGNYQIDKITTTRNANWNRQGGVGFNGIYSPNRRQCGAVDQTNNYLYFCTVTSSLMSYWNYNLGYSAALLGAGVITSMNLNSTTLWLGTGSGLGFTMQTNNQPADADIQDFQFSQNGVMTASWYDAYAGTLFWQDENSRTIFRYNPKDVRPWDNITLSTDVGFILSPMVGIFATNTPNVGQQSISRIQLADCSAFSSCSTCALGDPFYCGWCFSTQTCTAKLNASTCPNTLSTDPQLCPRIIGMEPISGSISGNTTVTISATLLPGTDISNTACSFDGQVVPATNMSNTAVTCQSPSVPTARFSTVLILYKGMSWVSDSTTFSYYDCNVGDCVSCKNSTRSECGWCLSLSSCVSNAITVCSLENFSSVCPVMVTSPASWAAGTTFNLKIGGGPFIKSSNYNLQIQGTSSLNVTWQNATQMTAVIPTLPEGIFNLNLNLNSKPYSFQSSSLLIYNCSSQSVCSNCFVPSKPLCSWCSSTRTCSSGPLTCSHNTTICPAIISVTPPSSQEEGGQLISVVVTGDGIPTGNVSCQFGATSVPGNWTKFPTNLICVTPPQTSGNSPLTIFVNGFPLTPSTDFFYFACGKQGDCGSCLDPKKAGKCSWCLGSGCINTASNQTCPVLFTSQCPAITSTIPANIYVNSPLPWSTIVKGTNFDSSLNYTCRFTTEFGNFTNPAVRFNSTDLGCDLPNLYLPSNQYESQLELQVESQDEIYTVNSVEMFIYDCDPSWASCATCNSQSQFCGWCIPTGQCMDSSLCNSTNFNLKNWVQTCPQVSDWFPKQGLREGGTIVTLTGHGLAINSPVVCQFGNQTVPAVSSGNGGNLTCVTPVNSQVENVNLTASTVPVQVLYQLEGNVTTNLVTDSLSFTFLGCSQYSRCDDCSVDPFNFGQCGWCLPLGRCVPTFMCSSSWKPSQCPTIVDVQPNVGSTDGGDLIEISGSNFVESDLYEIDFQGIPGTSLTWVDNKTLTVLSPPGSKGKIQLEIKLNGNAYAETTSFSYVEQNLTLIIILSVVFGVCGISSIIAGALLAYRFYRKSKRGELKMVKPEYENIAYGNWLFDQYEKPAGNSPEFEELLLDTDSPLPMAIVAVSQSTESDNLARSLVYLHESRGNTFDLIRTFIQVEIKSTKPDVMFRNNSIATKMFKFYSRIVGSRYLFDTLARFIAELDFGSRTGIEERNSNKIYNSSVDIELDPYKMSEDQMSDLQVNKLQFMLITQKIFNSIIKSGPTLPMQILSILISVRMSIAEKFPEDLRLQYKAMSAFFFLRFICPAISAPHAYGLLAAPPTDTCQRQLVLLSKCLQNIANATKFGAKEEFMAQMNDFVESNVETLQKFYDEISVKSQETINVQLETAERKIPKTVRNNSLAFIHQQVVLNKAKIFSELTTYGGKPGFQENLEAALGTLGEPAKKLKRTNSPANILE